MTIYVAGAESEIFGAAKYRDGTNYYDPNYTRGGFLTEPVSASYFDIPVPFGGDSGAGFWLRVRFYIMVGSGYANRDLVRFWDVGGSEIVRVQCTKGAFSGLHVTSSTGESGSTTLDVSKSEGFLDVHYYRDEESTRVDAYVDGSLVGSATAAGTNATVGKVAFQQLSHDMDYPARSAFSEVIIADEDTRGMRVKTVIAAGDDAAHNWVGTYAEIDEYGDAADGISAPSDGQTALFTHTNDIALNNIHSFVIAGRIAAATPDGAQGLVRLDGTNYETPFGADLAAGEQSRFAVFGTNPATGLPWTAADINSMSFGIKSGPPA